MAGQDSAPKIADLDGLLAYREITERISGFLNKRLRGHLSALSPLLTPARMLGKHVGAREQGPRADEVFAELSEKFQPCCGSPFNLKPDLDQESMSSIGSKIQVYPYEYNYEAQGSKSAKAVSMASPIRWVVTYGSEYSLTQLRSVLAAPGEHRPIRQFVLNAVTFQVILGRSPGLAQLLNDLRYEIHVQALPGLEKLPMVTIGVRVPSFRPPDDLLLTAIRLSGVSSFIELIDIDAVRSLEDPLRTEIEALLAPAA